MGCDIHGCVEVFFAEEWKKVIDIADFSPRNYNLFSSFFGVRGGSDYPYAERGFPEGASWYTRHQYCEDCDGNGRAEATLDEQARWKRYHADGDCERCCDWHSLTYITLHELEQHYDELCTIIEDSERWTFIFDMMHCMSRYVEQNVEQRVIRVEDDMSNARLIVWFDN